VDTSQKKSLTMKKRMLRVVVGALPGVVLGLLFHFVLENGAGASWAVGGIAAFVGAALAQPEVSTKNVLKGTAGTIVAYNAPRFMHKTIIDNTFGGEAAKPAEGQGNASVTPDGAKADGPPTDQT